MGRLKRAGIRTRVLANGSLGGIGPARLHVAALKESRGNVCEQAVFYRLCLFEYSALIFSSSRLPRSAQVGQSLNKEGGRGLVTLGTRTMTAIPG